MELTEHNKTTTYDVGNPSPGLRQAQKCGWVKPINGIPTFPPRQLDLQRQYKTNDQEKPASMLTIFEVSFQTYILVSINFIHIIIMDGYGCFPKKCR